MATTTTQFLPAQLDSLILAAIAGSVSAQHRLGDHYSFGFYDGEHDLVPISFSPSGPEGN